MGFMSFSCSRRSSAPSSVGGGAKRGALLDGAAAERVVARSGAAVPGVPGERCGGQVADERGFVDQIRWRAARLHGWIAIAARVTAPRARLMRVVIALPPQSLHRRTFSLFGRVLKVFWVLESSKRRLDTRGDGRGGRLGREARGGRALEA